MMKPTKTGVVKKLVEELLTPKEVAQYLRLSHGAVLALIHRGDLPAIRVAPRAYRIRRQDLEDYISRRYTGRKDGEAPATGGCG